MTNQLVSIITVTRNRCDLLIRAIESVLYQTYYNFEYIIIDADSEDDTFNVVNSFSDKRIKYLKLTENLPALDCIEIGVTNSQGNFLTFLDDDDEYYPEKIGKQVELLNSLTNDYGFVYCWREDFDDSTGLKISEHRCQIEGDVSNSIFYNTTTGTPTYMFRREAFLKIGGWNKRIPFPSDWEMILRFAQKYKTAYISEVLVKVHINHKYDKTRQTSLIKKTSSADMIKFHEYLLLEFKDCLIANPIFKSKQYKELIHHNIKLKNISTVIKLIFKIIMINPFAKHVYSNLTKGIYKGFKILPLCMFFY